MPRRRAELYGDMPSVARENSNGLRSEDYGTRSLRLGLIIHKETGNLRAVGHIKTETLCGNGVGIKDALILTEGT